MYSAIKLIRDVFGLLILSLISSIIIAGVTQVVWGEYLLTFGVFAGFFIGQVGVFLFFYGAYILDRANFDRQLKKNWEEFNNHTK